MVQAARDSLTDVRFGPPVRVGFAEVSGPDDLAALAGWPPERFPGPDLVAVLSVDLVDQLASALEALRRVLHEIVCCDGSAGASDQVPSGFDLATRALELGMGEDLVSTVPTAEGAVDHAVRSVAVGDSGWSGRNVLVVGSAAVVGRVRDHLGGRSPESV
jgi:hypothetical protein